MQFNNHLTPAIVREKVLMAIVTEHRSRHHQKSGIKNKSLFEQPSFHFTTEQYLEGKAFLASERRTIFKGLLPGLIHRPFL